MTKEIKLKIDEASRTIEYEKLLDGSLMLKGTINYKEDGKLLGKGTKELERMIYQGYSIFDSTLKTMPKNVREHLENTQNKALEYLVNHI